MPVIPTFTAQEPVPAGPMVQGVSPGAMAAPYQAQAQGYAGAADMLTRLASATAEARQADQLAQARAAFETRKAEIRAEVERTQDLPALRQRLGLGPALDPATDNLADVWTLASNAARDQVLPQVGGAARGLFGREATLSAARDRLDMVRLDARRVSDRSRAALDRELDDFALTYAGAGNDAAKAEAQARAMDAIALRESSGVLSAVDAEKARQSWRGRQQRAEIMRLTAASPQAALSALADPRRFPDVDPVVQAQMANAAAGRLQAQATAGMAAEMRAVRQAQQLADVASNRIVEQLELARQGRAPLPTLEDLQRFRDVLPGAQYRVLAEAVREAAGPGAKPGDAATRLELEGLVDTLPPAEFGQRVSGAVLGGQLSAGDGAQLIQRNRSARRDDAPPSPIQSGRRYVLDTLNPGDAAFANVPGQREQYAQRQMNAVADFDAWARANPGATPEKAEAKAREIVTRYRDTNPAALRTSLPLPYGFIGQRDGVTAEALASAKLALQGSNLTGPELAREVATLRAWESVLAQPAPAPRRQQGSGARGQGPNTAPRAQ